MITTYLVGMAFGFLLGAIIGFVATVKLQDYMKRGE